MLNPRNIIVAGTTVTTFVVVFHKTMQHQLIAAYPSRDPKLVKKAYNQMMLEGLRGNLIGVDLTDEFLTSLFNVKYANLTKAA